MPNHPADQFHTTASIFTLTLQIDHRPTSKRSRGYSYDFPVISKLREFRLIAPERSASKEYAFIVREHRQANRYTRSLIFLLKNSRSFSLVGCFMTPWRWQAKCCLKLLGLALGAVLIARPQATSNIPLQPFASQVRQIESALEYLGQPLSAAEQQQINDAIALSDEAAAVDQIEQVLDKHTLAIVDINAESRVQVRPGFAKPELIELGTRVFLVKVLNRAGVTARLTVESPNSGPVYIQSDTSAEPPMKLTPADVKERWADISLYDKNPISERLSGLRLEYRILQVYSQDRGQRSAKLGFGVGQGTQDIGFRNEMVVLFDSLPSHRVTMHVKDEKGAPAMAAFTVRDSLNRLYPNPSKRLAPDLFFQPQIYRADGETMVLPEGSYTVTCWMGPEYHPQTKKITIGKHGSDEISFNMQRWIDPSTIWLVFGRSPRACRWVLTLSESLRRRASGAHDAAGERRKAERRLRSDVGSLLLLSKTILQR